VGSQTHDDPSVAHNAAIEPVVRLSAQSRGHLLVARKSGLEFST
jgi:hypothetical protein